MGLPCGKVQGLVEDSLPKFAGQDPWCGGPIGRCVVLITPGGIGRARAIDGIVAITHAMSYRLARFVRIYCRNIVTKTMLQRLGSGQVAVLPGTVRWNFSPWLP
jgi:hypothetical protein